MGSGSESRVRTEGEHLGDLMVQAQGGDGSAYQALLAEVARILRSYVSRRLGGSEDVDEVVQDVLMSIHQSRHSYTPGRPFRPWMFAIARYRLADHYRKWGRVQSREVDGEKYFETLVGEESTGEDAAGRMAGALDSLPERQREIVTMLKLQGLSIRQASSKLSMSESAVKVAAHRAYKRMKRFLEVEGYEHP